jgi:hypothetical protein
VNGSDISNGSDGSPAQEDHLAARRSHAWMDLGVEGPGYEDEAGAPPVDRGKLVALYYRELPSEEEKRIFSLINRYRSWSRAQSEVLLELSGKELNADNS